MNKFDNARDAAWCEVEMAKKDAEIKRLRDALDTALTTLRSLGMDCDSEKGCQVCQCITTIVTALAGKE